MRPVSFITFFSLIFLALQLRAQSVPKIAIHLDRTEYFPGDTILFKGYVVTDGLLDSATRNVYIDWADVEGSVLENNVYVVVDGVFAAQYLVPKNYSGHQILLNAFTKSTVDFPNLIYDKSIAIYQKEGQAAAKEETDQIPELIVYPKIKQMLLHEPIGFLFKNPANTAFKGQIKTADGKVVEELESDASGEATIFLTPELKEYTLEWQLVNGGTIKTALPAVVDQGYKITVGESTDRYKLTVSKVGKINEAVTVQAYLDYHRLFEEKVTIADGEDVKTLALEKEGLGNGILQFLLYDVNGHLLQKEGLIVKSQDAIIIPEVSFVNRSLDPLGKNLLRVQLPDGESATVSVSITDAAFPQDTMATLSSDLWFKNIAKEQYENQFVKEIIRDDRYVAVLSKDDMGVKEKFAIKPDNLLFLEGQLEMKSKDANKLEKKRESIAEKGKAIRGISFGYQGELDPVMRYMEVPLDTAYSFTITNYIPFDTVQFRVTQIEEKMRFIPFQVKYTFYNLPKESTLRRMPKPAHVWGKAESIVDPVVDELRYRYVETLKNKDKTKLDTVQVNRRIQNEQRIKLLNDKYATGAIFNKANGRGLDVQQDKDAASSFNLFTYLQLGKIAGLQIIGQSMTNVPTVKYRRQATAFYINEIESTAEDMSNLGMNEVVYVKVIESPNAIVGDGPILAVYTLPNSEVKRDIGRLVDLQRIKGYTALRPFQNSNEKVSVNGFGNRITLYWNPLLAYDQSGTEKEIEFFNNNRAGKVMVTIQGITKSGKLLYYHKIL